MNKQSFSRALIAGLLLAVSLVPSIGAPAAAAASRTDSLSDLERAASEALSVTTIQEVTNALVAKDMEGRGTGQRGADRAAKYLADRFAKLGLKPAGTDGYLQPIKFKVEQALPDSRFKAGNDSFTYKRDFVVAPPRPDAPVQVSGDLAFVGYGVSVAELKRDDLAGIDLKGKLALVMGGRPRNADAAAWTKLASTQAVISKLAAAGTVGVILVYASSRETMSYPLISAYLTRRSVSVPSEQRPTTKPVPTLIVSEGTAEKLLADSGAAYSELKSKAEAGENVSRSLSKQASISVNIRNDNATSSNVAALLEGSDPKLKEEAVVLSAHYDAYGIDLDGTIYPGAADNAVGVAKLVGIAEALVKSKVRQRRSIIFLAVTGEEYGLLGAAHWVKHPTWPIEKVAANVNYDGIGTEVWGQMGFIVDYGFKHSDLAELLDGVLATQGLKVVPDPAPQEGVFYRSDHYEFFKKGIPSLYLIGVPANNLMGFMAKATKWLVTDYHMPTDTVQPDWNWDGARELAVVGLLASLRIANRDALPAWKESSPYNRPRGTNLPPPPVLQ